VLPLARAHLPHQAPAGLTTSSTPATIRITLEYQLEKGTGKLITAGSTEETNLKAAMGMAVGALRRVLKVRLLHLCARVASLSHPSSSPDHQCNAAAPRRSGGR
jgi:hypothetical protein